MHHAAKSSRLNNLLALIQFGVHLVIREVFSKVALYIKVRLRLKLNTYLYLHLQSNKCFRTQLCYIKHGSCNGLPASRTLKVTSPPGQNIFANLSFISQIIFKFLLRMGTTHVYYDCIWFYDQLIRWANLAHAQLSPRTTEPMHSWAHG